MTQHIFDARKLLCPLPVIGVQQRIKHLSSEDTLLVLATDRGVLYDIPAYCRIHGYHVIQIEQTANEIRLEISLTEPL